MDFGQESLVLHSLAVTKSLDNKQQGFPHIPKAPEVIASKPKRAAASPETIDWEADPLQAVLQACYSNQFPETQFVVGESLEKQIDRVVFPPTLKPAYQILPQQLEKMTFIPPQTPPAESKDIILALKKRQEIQSTLDALQTELDLIHRTRQRKQAINNFLEDPSQEKLDQILQTSPEVTTEEISSLARKKQTFIPQFVDVGPKGKQKQVPTIRTYVTSTVLAQAQQIVDQPLSQDPQLDWVISLATVTKKVFDEMENILDPEEFHQKYIGVLTLTSLHEDPEGNSQIGYRRFLTQYASDQLLRRWLSKLNQNQSQEIIKELPSDYSYTNAHRVWNDIRYNSLAEARAPLSAEVFIRQNTPLLEILPKAMDGESPLPYADLLDHLFYLHHRYTTQDRFVVGGTPPERQQQIFAQTLEHFLGWATINHSISLRDIVAITERYLVAEPYFDIEEGQIDKVQAIKPKRSILSEEQTTSLIKKYAHLIDTQFGFVDDSDTMA